MDTETTKRKLLFWLAFAGAAAMLVLVLVLIVLEVYVRWTINKDFTFLGGFELETLTIAVPFFILGLTYIYRGGSHEN